MNNMEASSSSSPFFGLREENFQAPPTHQQPPQLQLEQHSLAGTRAPASSSIGPPQKKKRSLPGAPSKYPDADVIALSPRTLMATNRFVCEVCNKGFQREQNLQLHRRGHNLPWKLKQKNKQDPVRKKVYLCPEPSCVHHDPSRALGDLTGIKKHYFRKHGEKKFKCEKCAKRYAVQSDWKAHSKTCGTREYRCDCGTLFSRRDSFITHRAFCDALAQESRQSTSLSALSSHLLGSTGDNVIGGGGNNNMSLGMGLSHQVTSHLDHQLASNILRLGGGPRHYDRLLGSPFRPQQPPPNNFYNSPDHQLVGPNQSNGGGFGNCGQDQNQNQNQNQGQSAGGGMFSVSNNLFHGQLNQLQNLQGGGNSQAFNNLGFFNSNNINNNNNSTTDTNTMNSGSTGSGDNSSGLFSPGTGLYGGPVVQMNSSNNGGGLSSLYNDNGGSITLQHQSAMSSATALLQKAAQMGSTTSTTNANAMKGFIMAKPPQPPPSPPTSSGGGFQGFYGETDQNNNLHDQLIRDLSRDNNNNNNHLLMNSSPFRDGGNHYYRGHHNGGIDANNKPVQGGLSAVSSSENPTRDFLGVGAIVRSNKSTSGGNSNNGISMANLNAHNAASNNNNSNAISNANDVNYPMPISNQPYGSGGNGFQ